MDQPGHPDPVKGTSSTDNEVGMFQGNFEANLEANLKNTLECAHLAE